MSRVSVQITMDAENIIASPNNEWIRFDDGSIGISVSIHDKEVRAAIRKILSEADREATMQAFENESRRRGHKILYPVYPI